VTDPNRLDGIGMQAGPLRPDWGPGWADLQCDRCDATWTGPLGEDCAWCANALERMVTWQAELTLIAPDIDPADERYDGAMEAWAERLAVAVDAEIITEAQADQAWQRAPQDAA
jgi:hypothetical protein